MDEENSLRVAQDEEKNSLEVDQVDVKNSLTLEEIREVIGRLPISMNTLAGNVEAAEEERKNEN